MNITIPIDVGQDGCMASLNDALYIVGGVNASYYARNSMFIFNTTTYTWTTGSAMIETRRAFACIVSPSNHKLYSIGGHGNGNHGTNTIEYMAHTIFTGVDLCANPC
eukprot:995601_1